MTTYSRGMGRVQLALSQLQQESHKDRVSLDVLPCCQNLWIHIESSMYRQRAVDAGGLALLSEASIGSQAVLGYTLEEICLAEAGHLDICFCWGEQIEEGICRKQGEFKCFLSGYCTVACTHSQTDPLLAHLFYKPLWNTNYLMQIRATECRTTHSTASLPWHLATNLRHADRPYLSLCPH